MYSHSHFTEEASEFREVLSHHSDRLVNRRGWAQTWIRVIGNPMLCPWSHVAMPKLWQSLKPYSYACRKEVGMILKVCRSDTPAVTTDETYFLKPTLQNADFQGSHPQ